ARPVLLVKRTARSSCTCSNATRPTPASAPGRLTLVVSGDVNTLGYDDFYHVTTPRRMTACFAMASAFSCWHWFQPRWHRPLSPLLPSPPVVTVGLLDASPVQELTQLGDAGRSLPGLPCDRRRAHLDLEGYSGHPVEVQANYR